jgi:hypothetical protein
MMAQTQVKTLTRLFSKDYVNLIVDDEPRYEFINVPNIYQR